MEVYLDANVVLDLFPAPDTALSNDLRRRLKAAVKVGAVTPILSGILFQELSRHSQTDWSRFRRMTRYLHEVGGSDLIADVATLLGRELRMGQPARGRMRFYPRDEVAQMWRAISFQSYSLEIIPLARAAARRHEMVETQNREEFRRQILSTLKPGASLTVELRKWWRRDPKARVASFGASTIARITREVLGFEVDSTYQPERSPAVWRFLSYYIARTYLRASENTKIEASDYPDPHHYALGGYADLLVTNDGGMHDAHDVLPFSDVHPIRLTPFVDRYLRTF